MPGGEAGISQAAEARTPTSLVWVSRKVNPYPDLTPTYLGIWFIPCTPKFAFPVECFPDETIDSTSS